MNDLEKYFDQNHKKLIHKWKHYFEIYDRHFARFRNQEVYLLEIGVNHGGSLQMWKDYFGPKAKIYGVDINPKCKQHEEEQINIIIGDQDDKKFLQSLAEALPRIDILIDDGGHTMSQQINTFEMLYDKVDQNGIYLCEDNHCSYWAEYNGGYQKPDTFIEFSKNFIDYIHAWHSQTMRLPVSQFTSSTHSLHYYDSILVIEKRPIKKPETVISGYACIN